MLSSTIKSIIEPQKQKSLREKQLKEKMMSMVLDKVKNYTSYGQTQCNFKVPPFLLGYIPFKQDSMVRYLASKLYKEGLYVEVNDNNLFISWAIKDIQAVQSKKRKEKIKEINYHNNKNKQNNDLKAFVSHDKLK
jgi:hypothetical protein